MKVDCHNLFLNHYLTNNQFYSSLVYWCISKLRHCKSTTIFETDKKKFIIIPKRKRYKNDNHHKTMKKIIISLICTLMMGNICAQTYSHHYWTEQPLSWTDFVPRQIDSSNAVSEFSCYCRNRYILKFNRISV